ncbi:tannase/feruloyl esterase family alpha/beta hydrolase [Streptomyces sp. NPDC051677]|uniref:tannase/feruloyl esterase family alpha/beta hydrolase n=1 Tax=Streptomyces sp. NPDC051677 TaxID=3365669 RepID=UPI0037D85F4F
MLTTSAQADDAASIRKSPQQACGDLSVPQVPGAGVESVTAVIRPPGDVAGTPPLPPVTSVPAVCDVTVLLSHPGVGDRVTTRVWLPLESWNGRYQSTGGGGYSASGGEAALATAVKSGYSAASTDAGVSTNGLDPSSWALDSQGRVNTGLLEDFSSRSLHDMAVIGKQITAGFYDRQTFYSYWNGCSTGGRQGWMEAQRYPDDYDGIMAAAPAANWDRFTPGNMWAQVVMNQEKDFLSPCELDTFTQAAITACDRNDGVADGVVDDPDRCHFDPRSLVGRQVVCDGKTLQITATDAMVVGRIWSGPTTRTGQFLWYGPLKSTSLTTAAGTVVSPDGTRTGKPFPVIDNWFKYFLKQDPAFDASTITYAEYEKLFRQSQREYNGIIGTDDPDLSAFKAAGGKMITWHGVSDRNIPVQGTVDYRKRVEREMGGARQVDSFFRVFLAPGVDHCGFGTGPAPTDPLAAVVNWVEHGKAPATLPASTTKPDGTVITRNLCRYPLQARYSGHGPTTSADSYTCRR